MFAKNLKRYVKNGIGKSKLLFWSKYCPKHETTRYE
jgi:quinolinate synthase